MQGAQPFARTSARTNRGTPRLLPAVARPPDGIAALASACRPGWSLPGEFYRDEAIYRADLERIWRPGWLFAGHSCEIPKPGDYFTLEVDTDSIIVIRGEDAAVRGLHNVCRHRGSLICGEQAEHVTRLVCPYHQWTYARNGTLLACRGMQDDLDKSQFSLRPVHVREIEGLIYFCLANDAADFEPANRFMAPLLRPQGFNQAKVAKTVDYLVKANWKLVWENNRECYHCNLNHPQYIKAN